MDLIRVVHDSASGQRWEQLLSFPAEQLTPRPINFSEMPHQMRHFTQYKKEQK
jgi:hypothetical protein